MESKQQPSAEAPRDSSLIVILIVGALVLLGGVQLRRVLKSSGGEVPGQGAGHEAVGRPLTALQLQPLTGDPPPVTLEQLKGRVALINYWGTWCPPCREEFPHLVKLRRLLQNDRDFVMLSVSCGPEDQTQLLEMTADFLREEQTPDLPTYHDLGQASRSQLERDAGIQMGYPTTVALDRNGIIRGLWTGYRPGTEDDMQQVVESLLNGSREQGMKTEG